MTPVAELVRRHDPDRYFCTLFAPASRRDALMTLYAFNHELARAAEVAREPGLALIRLQWWREVVEGTRRRHEVATPLNELIAANEVLVPFLTSMIEAREEAIEGGDNMASLRGGPGALAAAAGTLLGATRSERDALVSLGIACGIAGLLRNRGLTQRPGEWRDSVDCEMGLALLSKRSRWRRPVAAAALPAVFARRDVQRLQPVGARGISDQLAVLTAAITGWI